MLFIQIRGILLCTSSIALLPRDSPNHEIIVAPEYEELFARYSEEDIKEAERFSLKHCFLFVIPRPPHEKKGKPAKQEGFKQGENFGIYDD